jgi:hypothetical protein
MHNRTLASLTLAGTVGKDDTHCLDNGGSSGEGYWINVHPATLRSILHRGSGRFSPFSCSLCRPSGAYSSSSTFLYIYFE